MSTLNPNELLWIPDDVKFYELARIVQDHIVEADQKEEMVIVETLDKKRTEKKFAKSLTYLVDKSHLIDLPDLIEMNSLHEAPLLDVLRRRWLKDSMYTNTGEILVSINPYHQIEKLYENPLKYLDLAPKKENAVALPPHVFGIANNALRETIRPKIEEDEKISQSIIVTGESGAGKTEASKQVMNFLTLANKETSPEAGESAEKIKNVILDSNSIFEAFGNSKTVRNDNSSRFGKYIKLQYTAENQLWAAHTETFLLEKSRLVSVSKDDRNYHIFYQMVRGLDSATKSKLKLDHVDSFKILNNGGCTVITTEEDDVIEFQAVAKALPLMGCTAAEIAQIWELLACVLHLGNVTCNKPTSETESVTIDSPTMAMQEITDIFGIPLTGFMKALTVQVVKVKQRDEQYEKLLSADDTKNNVNALVKWIYGGLFNWLVAKVNSAHQSISTNQKKAVVKFIGILDIFGFEILLRNTFEQICINYTNERLQQQFNELAFEVEQQEYAKEGLNWTSINYRDNQPVIDLIGKKPQGLLIILEEHSLMNREPDDNALLSTFHKLHFNQHPNYAKPRFGNESFVIKHFAGDVDYAIASFIVKNNDSLQEDLSELLASSGNKFLIDILNNNAMNAGDESKSNSATANPAASGKLSAASGTKIASSVSVSMRFRGQLDTLVTTLRSTKAFYIKCIKPNGEKKAGVFNAPMVITQLRYSGVLEIVRIRREGYPTRLTYKEFYEEFQQLSRGKKWVEPGQCTPVQMKEYCRLLCTEYCPKESFQLGNKFLFLHHYVPQVMRSALHAARMKSATKIQAAIRGHLAYAKFHQKQKSTIAIQSVMRMARAKRLRKEGVAALAEKRRIAAELAKKSMDAATLLQSHLRTIPAKRELNALKLAKRRNDAAIKLQSQLRTIPAKRELKKLDADKRRRELECASATKMQAMARRTAATKQFAITIKAVTNIQRIARGKSARKDYLKHRVAAIALETMMRGKLARMKYQLQLKSVTRMQLGARQFLRNLRNRKLILEFHAKCKSGDVSTVKNMLTQVNSATGVSVPHTTHLYRNKWAYYCTMYQSAASGIQISILKDFNLSPMLVLERDVQASRLLHWAVTNPDMAMIKYLCEVMNQIKTTVIVNIKEEEDNDEDEEEVVGDGAGDNMDGKVDLVTGLPILKSGWMKKSSTILGFKSWKRRYCVLTEESFVLYKQVNKKPAGYIPIEGCIIERAHGTDHVLAVKKPRPTAVKRSMFSSGGEHDAYTMRTDNETELQEWLKALSLAAGVRPFRDGPINHLNMGIRTAWVQMYNNKDETPLHSLAGIGSTIFTTRGDDAVKVAAWLIENGINIDQKNEKGQTALQVAIANQNTPVIKFLTQRKAAIENTGSKEAPRASISVLNKQALDQNKQLNTSNNRLPATENTDSGHLLQAMKPKGFSYLQIHLEKLYCIDEKKANFDGKPAPRLVISVCNSQNKPIEAVQEIEIPALIRKESIYWGYTWYMQTPLESVGDDFSIVIRILQADQKTPLAGSLAEQNLLPVLTAKYRIDKEKIDSGKSNFTFSLQSVLEVSDADIKKQNRMSMAVSKTSTTPASNTPTGPIENILDAEFEITKFFRKIDLEKIENPEGLAPVRASAKTPNRAPRAPRPAINTAIPTGIFDGIDSMSDTGNGNANANNTPSALSPAATAAAVGTAKPPLKPASTKASPRVVTSTTGSAFSPTGSTSTGGGTPQQLSPTPSAGQLNASATGATGSSRDSSPMKPPKPTRGGANT